MSALEAARKAARKAHEALYYCGVCTVTEYQDVTDETTKITRQQEVETLTEQPCNLSFETLDTVDQTDTAAALTQGLKLFIAPEVTIKAGSKLTVTQNGVTGVYAMSGEPAVYADHQEIMLKLFEGWA
ncbi:MAG: hypothetical protein LUH07_09520 [Lachnospiraceae bacterium]|nr:hypothetical protein [Lachnospiraceae bacterium]